MAECEATGHEDRALVDHVEGDVKAEEMCLGLFELIRVEKSVVVSTCTKHPPIFLPPQQNRKQKTAPWRGFSTVNVDMDNMKK